MTLNETGHDIELLADVLHEKVCGPFTTIDPQQCLGTRERDVRLAKAIAEEYERRVGRTPTRVVGPCPYGQCGHSADSHTPDHGCWEDDCMCEAPKS